jgi:two-component system response regulator HydG
MMASGRHGFWEKVIETLTEGLVVIDSRGTILALNHAMEEITGYRRDELLGHPCSLIRSDACFCEEPSGALGSCCLFRNGESRRDKCALVKRNGSLVHVLRNAALLKDERSGETVGVETFTEIGEMVARERVMSRPRRELRGENGFQGMIGHSPVMLRFFSLLSSAAQSDAPVMILGESGTGKELVATALHRLGPRREEAFIKVNSAALQESLLESELFGHVKGAFTGADRTRIGRFEAAHRGDIFLDEVGDLPLATQVKLLRVLQEKVIERVGDHRPIPVDVRVISASNQDLARLRAEGRFRDDFFYRINVIPIHLPPLRQRREDIPLLVDAFVKRTRLKTRKLITGIEKGALDSLMAYSWPGNVRELINVIQHAFVLCHEGDIQPEHLPVLGQQEPARLLQMPERKTAPCQISRERLLDALAQTGGGKGEAARILGVSRVTLWKWMKRYDLQVQEGTVD